MRYMHFNSSCAYAGLANLGAFVAARQSPEALRGAMDPLFRPLLLDGLAMMQLAGHEEQAQRLRALQEQFLSAVRREAPLRLADELHVPLLEAAIDGYIALIRARMAEKSAD